MWTPDRPEAPIGDGSTQLGTLLRDTGLTREFIAQKLDMSKHAIDSWCSGRCHVRLAKAGALIKVMEERGADPVRLRDLLLDQLVRSGLSAQVAQAYLGFRGAPKGDNEALFVILADDLRVDSQFLAASMVRNELLQAGCKVVVLDCSGTCSIRRYYLQDLLPNLSPRGLVMCMYASGIELDSPAANLARLGIPTVYFNQRPRVLPRNAAFVGWDDYELGYIAGRTVAESGLQRSAMVLYEDLESHAMRKRGFIRALADYSPGTLLPPSFLASVASEPIYRNQRLIGEAQRFMREHQPQVIFAPALMLGLTLVTARNPSPGEPLGPIRCVSFSDGGRPTSLIDRLPQLTFSILDVPMQAAAKQVAEQVLALSRGHFMPLRNRVTVVPYLTEEEKLKRAVSDRGRRGSHSVVAVAN